MSIARRQFITIATLGGLSAAMTSCAGNDNPTGPVNVDQLVTPSATPTGPVPSHVDGVPPGFEAVSGTGFRIAFPQKWTNTYRAGSTRTGDTWLSQDTSSATLSAASVVLDAHPTSSALNQSYVLESSLQVNKPTSSIRYLTTWPGASTAVMVDWVVNGKRTQQLITERVDGGPILSVLVMEKTTGEFSPTLQQVLASFTLTD